MVESESETVFPIGHRLRLPLAWATACYVVVLVIGTHYPRPGELLSQVGAAGTPDKTLHVVAYGVLGLLAAATLAAWGRWTWRNLLLLAGGLALFGVVDEATQPLFERFADFFDWVADCEGIAIGLVAVAAGRAWWSGSRKG
jgi:VanZ family protein